MLHSEVSAYYKRGSERKIICTPGVDFGNDLEVISICKTNPNIFMVRVKGSMQWSGLYSPREYFETRYYIVEIGEKAPGTRDNIMFSIKMIEEHSFGRKYRTGIQSLKQKWGME